MKELWHVGKEVPCKKELQAFSFASSVLIFRKGTASKFQKGKPGKLFTPTDSPSLPVNRPEDNSLIVKC